jgi:hypothetical protein
LKKAKLPPPIVIAWMGHQGTQASFLTGTDRRTARRESLTRKPTILFAASTLT